MLAIMCHVSATQAKTSMYISTIFSISKLHYFWPYPLHFTLKHTFATPFKPSMQKFTITLATLSEFHNSIRLQLSSTQYYIINDCDYSVW